MITSNGPREQILLMGGWGAGKSTAISDIARNISGRVYVIDTTYEAERNYHGQDNVIVERVEQWDDYLAGIRKATVRGTRDDWLAVDRVDPVWDSAQNGFIEKVFGKTADAWFVEFRAESSGHPLAGEYGMNWAVIKKMYGAFMTEVMRFKGNVIVTARADQIQNPNRDGSGGDSTEIRAEFGKYGVKPAGEKNLGFLFHTVLLLAEPRQGEWTYTTIRDRNRPQMKGETMKSFCESYLIPIAGWTTSETESNDGDNSLL